jgi:hypothetical protein
MTKEETKNWILERINKDFDKVTEEHFKKGLIWPTLDYYAEIFEEYHKDRLRLLNPKCEHDWIGRDSNTDFDSIFDCWKCGQTKQIAR